MYGVFVALGVFLGFLVTNGVLRPLSPVITHVNTTLIEYGDKLVSWLLGQFSSLDGSQEIVLVLVPVLSVMTPGIVVLFLCITARSSDKLKHLGAGIVLVLGLSSFFFLEPAQAVLVLIASIVLAAFSSLATGLILQVPLILLSTVLAVQQVSILLAGKDPTIVSATNTLVETVSVGDSSLWRVTLLAMALLPFAGALTVLLKAPK